MTDLEQSIRNQLLTLQDPHYREFQCRLIPTVPADLIIGIRIPVLRSYAKTMFKESGSLAFLQMLPHRYYDENNLHAFLLEQLPDYNECIRSLDAFLPYVDNWSTCDSMKPKVFRKHLPELIQKIPEWLNDSHPYTVRFGIEMLMNYYLGEGFRSDYADLVSAVQSSEYYVNMMIAWYFATALAKNYDQTILYIEENRLTPFVHNKSIQKALESYRVTAEHKDYLRTLKCSGI